VDGSSLTLSGVLSDETAASASMIVTNGGLLTFTPATASDSGIYTNFGGLLELSNSANSFSGQIAVTGGTLKTANFPASATNAPIALASCELQYTGATAISSRPFSTTGDAIISVVNSGTNLSLQNVDSPAAISLD